MDGTCEQGDFSHGHSKAMRRSVQLFWTKIGHSKSVIDRHRSRFQARARARVFSTTDRAFLFLGYFILSILFWYYRVIGILHVPSRVTSPRFLHELWKSHASGRILKLFTPVLLHWSLRPEEIYLLLEGQLWILRHYITAYQRISVSDSKNGFREYSAVSSDIVHSDDVAHWVNLFLLGFVLGSLSMS